MTVRVFPRRTSMTPTDVMAFVGDPPLWRPEADEVHVSVAFSWDIAEGKRLQWAWQQYYSTVRLGGPAIHGEGDGFEPGMYLKQGIVITSRGCPNRCPWCLISGPLRLLDIRPGWIVQDNNLLATGREHMSTVFAMLKAQRRAVEFSGGLEAALLDDWVAEELRGLSIGQLFLAADTDGALGPLERALKRVAFLPRDKKRVYVLLSFNGETMTQGERRLRRVWELGAMPFAQLYQPPDDYINYSVEWRRFARRWQRPAIMKAVMANG